MCEFTRKSGGLVFYLSSDRLASSTQGLPLASDLVIAIVEDTLRRYAGNFLTVYVQDGCAGPALHADAILSLVCWV